MKATKILGLALLGAALSSYLPAFSTGDRQSYKVYVDDDGVMRRSDTKEEVSYYGTNYTAPFAYSYRALGYLGKDRKEAIDRDVYHIARLGLNAFRLHLWDAELTDADGNLLQNDHLDLLDYMIQQLEERGIDIILTAQTNFGNGYPEKDIDTGAFTYDFDKCRIHDDPKAQKIQENYLKQLAKHVNPYTGRSYAKDNAIIAMEINNEPCHSGTKEEVTRYIDLMAKTLRKAGFDKPILYNVTHNPDITEAYYDADIDGTTYQWYPTGLVAGHERKGNLLPAFDEYTIPWKDSMPNYDKLARVVYEFDPADVMYSHLYPAVARTFRKEGFQWITQFAYDPIDVAPFNTEYPTHYLNLVYTPAKALSMMVAAEVAREIPRGADYGQYPANTTFGNTSISYEKDLSIYNTPEKFIYTNDTDAIPADLSQLRQLAGHGSSPAVAYSGNGAYFLDQVGESGVWRLEVFPDVTVVSDPFGDTSLQDTKVVATFNSNKIKIKLPSLGPDFIYKGINNGNQSEGKASDCTFEVMPGTYLLAHSQEVLDHIKGTETVAGNIGLKEYASPNQEKTPFTLISALRSDPALDTNMIPEAWDFRLERKQGFWYDPVYYQLETWPKEDGMFVIRRYVGDKISRIPESIETSGLKIRFLGDTSSLPEGAEIAVVTKDGFTFSAPISLDADGVGEVTLGKLHPHKGVIMPAPYPTMLTREYPAAEGGVKSIHDVEFVEILLPQTAGANQNLQLERVWAE